MLGHPGGEEHSSYLIELSFLPPPRPVAGYGCRGRKHGTAVTISGL